MSHKATKEKMIADQRVASSSQSTTLYLWSIDRSMLFGKKISAINNNKKYKSLSNLKISLLKLWRNVVLGWTLFTNIQASAKNGQIDNSLM